MLGDNTLITVMDSVISGTLILPIKVGYWLKNHVICESVLILNLIEQKVVAVGY